MELFSKLVYDQVSILSNEECILVSVFKTLLRYRDGAGNTTEENSSIFSVIRMR